MEGRLIVIAVFLYFFFSFFVEEIDWISFIFVKMNIVIYKPTNL